MRSFNAGRCSKNMLYGEKPGMRDLMKGTFLMHCVILKDESWMEQKDHGRRYEAVLKWSLSLNNAYLCEAEGAY